MPTLCKYENCRRRPKMSDIFCSLHVGSSPITIGAKCRGLECTFTSGSKNFKGYCSDCYIRIFKDDPLSIQTRCKTKEIAINEFIHCYFDGFQHPTPLWIGEIRIDNRIVIENTIICINVLRNGTCNNISYEPLDHKIIIIRINTGKYMSNGKSVNPMLYIRMPTLEKEINHQINRVLQKENNNVVEVINLFCDSV
jgi:hypothetical protein